MGAAAPAMTNFNGGELSPTIEGRIDINKYTNGCYKMEGFIPLVQGPARRRSGTRFVDEVKDSNDRTWLVPFKFSGDVSYMLEFGDGYIRIYLDHELVIYPKPPNYNGATTYAVGDLVFDTVGSLSYYCIRATTGNAPPNATYWYQMPDVPPIYEIPTPYALADLTNDDGTFAIEYAQTGDIIYFVHPGYKPRKMTREGALTWRFSEIDFKGGPFIGVDPDNTITVYASAETGTGITLTASSSIFTSDHVGALFLLEARLTDPVTAWEPGKVIALNSLRRSDGNVYKALNGGATTGASKPVHLEGARYDGDAGVQWEYQHSGYGWVIIRTASGTTATADVISRIPSSAVGAGNPTTRWSFSELSASRGWPSHVTFFKERLVLMRGAQVFMSVASDFENFQNRDGADVTADMAISITVASDEINDAAWLAPASKLLIGTLGNEVAVGELSSSEALGPANINAVTQTGHGSRQVRPVKVNDSILFIQKAGRKLREIRFTFESDGYATTDLSVLADHITRGQIIQMAYQQEPHSIVWMVCNNGELIGFTFNREQEVLGWHRHPIGGDGYVESVACIPSPDGARDEVWFIVKRTINGVTKRYVEYMERDWISVEGMAIEDAFFVDSGLTYDGAPATIISGLDHLEGETVAVLADGVKRANATVSGGSITISPSASVVQVGLPYTSKLTTMRIEAGGDLGTAQGKTKRISEVVFRLLDSRGGTFGNDGGTMDDIRYYPADYLGTPTYPYSGDTEKMAWPEGYETDGRITIKQEDPYPMTVVAVFPELETNT
jgi:hypothetical protein